MQVLERVEERHNDIPHCVLLLDLPPVLLQVLKQVAPTRKLLC